MRKSAAVLLASISPIALGACGSPPQAATPVAAQNVVVPPPPPPPPLVDPVGLVTIAPPQTSVCELVGKNAFEVSATVDGPALFHLKRGDVKMLIGAQGEALVVATTPSFTIRGYVAHDPSGDQSQVFAAKWLSFGGVYFPSIHDALVATVHDGKVSIAAREDRGFHFTPPNGTLDVACDDIAIDPDAKEVLRNSLPPAFEKHDGKLSVLKYTKSVSLSADADGPAVGTFDVTDGPATVTVIERRGKKAHIRSDHFIGWIDASALKAFTSSSRKDIDAEGGVVGMQMLAAIGGDEAGASASSDASKTKAVTSTLVCPTDVRILALTSASPNTPFAIGTIPAGKPVHLLSKSDDVSSIVLDDDPRNARVDLVAPNYFAVPNKDLAACTVSSTGAPPVVRKGDDYRDMIDEANEQDMIDQLPAETPKKTSRPK